MALNIKNAKVERLWPHIPPGLRDEKLTKREREAILGIGPDGYPK